MRRSNIRPAAKTIPPHMITMTTIMTTRIAPLIIMRIWYPKAAGPGSRRTRARELENRNRLGCS